MPHKLPGRKRNREFIPAENADGQDIAINDLVETCYHEHIWPRISSSLLDPGGATAIHHEVEIAEVISSTHISNISSTSAATASSSVASPSSSLLHGFIRKLQTSDASSALMHLMPTGLCNAVQCLSKQHSSDPIIVWEESVTYSIQHVHMQYTLTQRKRTRLNPITQQCSPVQTEWKCKYHVTVNDQRVQIAREAQFDDQQILTGQALLLSCIDMGLVDISVDDPHIVEPLFEGRRLLFVWSIPQPHWTLDVRLVLNAADTCTPSRVMQCLRAARNTVSADVITKAIGSTRMEWRVELEYKEFITLENFCAGFAALRAFVRLAARDISNDQFLELLHPLLGTEQHTLCCISVRLLPAVIDDPQRTQSIRVAAIADLSMLHQTFLTTAAQEGVHTVPPMLLWPANVPLPYPKQPRPRDITPVAFQSLAVGYTLATAKLDGCETFLLGTALGLLMISRVGWVAHQPWASGKPVPPTPFLMECEFIGQQRVLSCYDVLLLPNGSTMCKLPYRDRICHLTAFLAQYGPTMGQGLYTVTTKPFFAFSAFPACALLQCFRWIQNTQLPADGFVVSCGISPYWQHNAMKIKFAPSLDVLLHRCGQLPARHFQLLLRTPTPNTGIQAYGSLHHQYLPLVACASTDADAAAYNRRVIELCPGRQGAQVLVVREGNKQPNYISNARDLLHALHEGSTCAVARVFCLHSTCDIVKIIQYHKWNYTMSTIHAIWQSHHGCAEFVIVEIGGGNGGDVHKWLTLAQRHPLTLVHVIEPDGDALAQYRHRIQMLPSVSAADLVVRVPGRTTALRFCLHACTYEDWSPPPRKAGTAVCTVLNFSLPQVVHTMEQFVRLLRHTVHAQTDHVVGIMHSYGPECESRLWSNGLTWRHHQDGRATVTIQGTKLAIDITEGMLDIGSLQQEAQEHGFLMQVDPLLTTALRKQHLHWLLNSLHGFCVQHSSSLTCIGREKAHVPIQELTVARTAAMASNHTGHVVVVVHVQLFVFTVPGVALLQYLGPMPPCGPMGATLQHPLALHVIDHPDSGHHVWRVACDHAADNPHRYYQTALGYVVSCL